MAVGFLSLLAGVICERTTPKNGLRSLIVLAVWGVGTVLYWYATQEKGHGDLRPYIILQFGSLLAILLLLALLPPRKTHSGDLVVSLGIYALAMVFEQGDHLIFTLGGIVSGHTKW
jgi:glucose uptake protein GlcU